MFNERALRIVIDQNVIKASQSGSTVYETFSQTTKEKSRYIRYKIL